MNNQLGRVEFPTKICQSVCDRANEKRTHTLVDFQHGVLV